jgi:hypothetical protein
MDDKAMIRLIVLASVLAMGLAACAPSSHILVGTARPPISPSDVKVYPQPPPTFEQIAILNASAHSMFGTGGQGSVDKVVQRLKEQAAQLGANGIILEGMSDRQTGSLGGGSGSTSYSSNSAVGVGVGASLGIFKKTGEARAIFVPPGSAPAPPGSAPAPPGSTAAPEGAAK